MNTHSDALWFPSLYIGRNVILIISSVHDYVCVYVELEVFDSSLRRDHWLPFLCVLWVPPLSLFLSCCCTKTSWSTGRSLSHAATFLSPFEKFLRNTRKVPATGATPSHWPGRNEPIEQGCNHTYGWGHTNPHAHTHMHMCLKIRIQRQNPSTLQRPSPQKNTIIDPSANQQQRSLLVVPFLQPNVNMLARSPPLPERRGHDS